MQEAQALASSYQWHILITIQQEIDRDDGWVKHEGSLMEFVALSGMVPYMVDCLFFLGLFYCSTHSKDRCLVLYLGHLLEKCLYSWYTVKTYILVMLSLECL